MILTAEQKATLKLQIAEYERQRQQYSDDANAAAGAKMAIENLLKLSEAAEAEQKNAAADQMTDGA